MKPESVSKLGVAVRVRPLLAAELDRGNDKPCVLHTDVQVSAGKLEAHFDAVFGEDSTQDAVYGFVRDCASRVASGYNATVFAYGQTGSGKTFTMYGSKNDEGGDGVLPRAVQSLFSQLDMSTARVSASCVQIYCENVFDMLRDPARATALEIRRGDDEQGKGAHYVSGLSEFAVRSAGECVQLVRAAEENRAIRETQMNTASSRSHSIFTLLVEQRVVGEDGETSLRSKYNLVDLAGSERWDVMQEMGEARVAEMTKINLSLHTLGRCISALAAKHKGNKGDGAEGNPSVHVPYRESKLTRLLQDSLGGNSMTRLIATISPAQDCVDESISTLRFADRAKHVVSSVRRNEHRPIDHAMVQKLQREVRHLRALLQGDGEAPQLDVAAELARLREENAALRAQLGAPARPPASGGAGMFPALEAAPSATSKHARAVADHVGRLQQRNADLEEALEEIRDTSKAFFGFEIEEDELRRRLQAAVDAVAHAPQIGPPPVAPSPKPQPMLLLAQHTKPRGPPADARPRQPDTAPRQPDGPRHDGGPRQPDGARPPSDAGESAYSRPGPDGRKPKYRIKAAGRSSGRDDAWIDPDVEEAEALKRELKAAKARMKKHAQMKEWLLRKSEMEGDDLRAEDEARAAAQREVDDREKTYRKRASKQKKKLEKYYDQLHGADARFGASPTRDAGSESQPRSPSPISKGAPLKKSDKPHVDDVSPMDSHRHPRYDPMNSHPRYDGDGGDEQFPTYDVGQSGAVKYEFGADLGHDDDDDDIVAADAGPPDIRAY
ncbi:P-loop containing nucleoside triphosphate hydrolase protein [Pelagophyceae sp. CCMP2097]|nr:P-loop containing nucleoside triphosphate hydrolase protein [Pelagophyceae sp. CCMP2097]